LSKAAIRIKNELTDIMANKSMTIDELATKYNVSARTVHRDFLFFEETIQ